MTDCRLCQLCRLRLRYVNQLSQLCRSRGLSTAPVVLDVSVSYVTDFHLLLAAPAVLAAADALVVTAVSVVLRVSVAYVGCVSCVSCVGYVCCCC